MRRTPPAVMTIAKPRGKTNAKAKVAKRWAKAKAKVAKPRTVCSTKAKETMVGPSSLAKGQHMLFVVRVMHITGTTPLCMALDHLPCVVHAARVLYVTSIVESRVWVPIVHFASALQPTSKKKRAMTMSSQIPGSLCLQRGARC